MCSRKFPVGKLRLEKIPWGKYPTPINDLSRMQSLLGGDEDDEWTRQPMSDEELALMPRLIPENVRYACGMKDCKYITIDEVIFKYSAGFRLKGQTLKGFYRYKRNSKGV